MLDIVINFAIKTLQIKTDWSYFQLYILRHEQKPGKHKRDLLGVTCTRTVMATRNTYQ